MKYQSICSLILLILCFTVHTISSHAQVNEPVFAPIGATWYYSPGSTGPPWVIDPLKAYFLVEKDTFMLGFDARVVGCYVNEDNIISRVDSLTKYIATSGDKVYYKVEDEFVLLFDFGAQAGDTIYSSVEDFGLNIGCGTDFSHGVIDFSYVVDSIGMTFVDGEELRILYVHSISQSPDPDWIFWEPIIERIGPMNYGAFWWGHGEGCILESGYLRCYIDPEINWRSSYYDDNLPCDYISATSEIQALSYTLHPNPASIFINLPPDAEQVRVYDLTGRNLQITHFENELDISMFPSGMYTIRFELDGVMRVGSFIKI